MNVHSARLGPTLLIVAVLAVSPVGLGIARAQSEATALESALAQFDEGQPEAAIATLRAFLASDSEEPRLRATALLGSLLVETGQGAEALDVLVPLAERPDAPAAVLYNAGRAALQTGDPQRALQWLGRSAQLEPESPARRELGVLLGTLGQYREAYPHLRSWVRSNPDDGQARLLAALAAVELQRVGDAERLLAELPQDDPRVQLLWGKTLVQQGDPWGALGYLRPLQESAPPEMQKDVRRTLARAHLMVGESETAIELLEGQTGEDPALAVQLADAYYQSGNVEAALSALQPFAEGLLGVEDFGPMADTAASVARTQGQLLLTSGKAAEAVPYLELATRLAPEVKQPWQNLGQALAATGRQEEAQQAIARFQELVEAESRQPLGQEERDLEDPTGREIRQAMQELAQGDPQAALARLMRESDANPEDPRPPLIASRILLMVEQPDAALQAVERALALAPGNPDALYQRGAVLMALGRFDEAERQLRAALEVNPQHTGALNDLAVLYMEQDRDQEAIELLERALELRPDDPLARSNLEALRAEG